MTLLLSHEKQARRLRLAAVASPRCGCCGCCCGGYGCCGGRRRPAAGGQRRKRQRQRRVFLSFSPLSCCSAGGKMRTVGMAGQGCHGAEQMTQKSQTLLHFSRFEGRESASGRTESEGGGAAASSSAGSGTNNLGFNQGSCLVWRCLTLGETRIT